MDNIKRFRIQVINSTKHHWYNSKIGDVYTVGQAKGSKHYYLYEYNDPIRNKLDYSMCFNCDHVKILDCFTIESVVKVRVIDNPLNNSNKSDIGKEFYIIKNPSDYSTMLFHTIENGYRSINGLHRNNFDIVGEYELMNITNDSFLTKFSIIQHKLKKVENDYKELFPDISHVEFYKNIGNKLYWDFISKKGNTIIRVTYDFYDDQFLEVEL